MRQIPVDVLHPVAVQLGGVGGNAVGGRPLRPQERDEVGRFGGLPSLVVGSDEVEAELAILRGRPVLVMDKPVWMPLSPTFRPIDRISYFVQILRWRGC